MSTINTPTETYDNDRIGAGRKPKAMIYAPYVEEVELFLAKALLPIAQAMYKRALEGDNVAGKYLMNRLLGTPAQLADPPSNERILPYNEANLENAVLKLANSNRDNSVLDIIKNDIFEGTHCKLNIAETKSDMPGIAPVNTSGNEESLMDWLMKNIKDKGLVQYCMDRNLDPRKEQASIFLQKNR